jgi:hypothetical protein
LCRDYQMSSFYLIHFNEFLLISIHDETSHVTRIIYTIHCVTMMSCCLLVLWFVGKKRHELQEKCIPLHYSVFEVSFSVVIPMLK